MRIIRNLGAILLAATMLVAVAGCSNTNTESTDKPTTSATDSSGTTSGDTSSGTTTAKPYDDTAEEIKAIKEARVGDTIVFNDYCVFVQSDGTKVYYADGAYAFVFNTIVVETRKAVNIADSNASIDEVLELDDDFRLKTDIEYYFYNADNEPVTYSGSSRLTSEIPYCLVEYVDWADEAKTQGHYYSYAFSYGDAPVKICSVYVAEEDKSETEGTESTESTTSAPEDAPSESTTE